MCTFGTKIGGFSALPIDLSAYVEMNKKKFIFFRFGWLLCALLVAHFTYFNAPLEDRRHVSNGVNRLTRIHSTSLRTSFHGFIAAKRHKMHKRDKKMTKKVLYLTADPFDYFDKLPSAGSGQAVQASSGQVFYFQFDNCNNTI